MVIFNSLGSNWDLWSAIKFFFALPSNENKNKLTNYLESKYHGKALLFYKGRQALSYCLQNAKLPKDSYVAINSLTCVVVKDAIINNKLRPYYLDSDGNLNFSYAELKSAIQKNKISAVIIQNTFGYPCDIEKITSFCHKNKILLIEDLAHCIGTKYSDKKYAGDYGDMVALSFSQDKMIDVVSGGALIDKTGLLVSVEDELIGRLSVIDCFKDKLYPLLTFKIRFLYNFGVGKYYHYLIKKINLLSTPIKKQDHLNIEALPTSSCSRILTELHNLEKQINHRKKLSKIYAENLNKAILIPSVTNNIEYSTNLRFPIFVEGRGILTLFLKLKGIHLSDIWYDKTLFPCPHFDKIARTIINLP